MDSNQVQVVWLRPTEERESWYNIFVLHQNRVQHYKVGPGQKARSIQERDLPEWLDMVRDLLYLSICTAKLLREHSMVSFAECMCASIYHVDTVRVQIIWGHEHECKQTEDESTLENKAFRILQPGSTVATSLSEPESKPKACFCLEICKQVFRLSPRLLRSVRPFKFKAVFTLLSRSAILQQ
jgi:hypothetical protein